MDVDKVIFEAPTVRSVIQLARMFGMNATTLRYRLMKARKLELVKAVIYWANDERPLKCPRIENQRRSHMKSKDILKAHGLYMCGMSLSKVAPRFGVTRTNLWGWFNRMNLPMRPLKRNACKEFNGIKYYKMKDGLYRGGKPRRFIHYAIWGEPVPEDCVLVFKDGNKDNIVKENLMLAKKGRPKK